MSSSLPFQDSRDASTPTPEIRRAIGVHIAASRKAMGLTQESLALLCFVTRNAVAQWETGRSLPTKPALAHLAVALEVNASGLTPDAWIDPRPCVAPRPVAVRRVLARVAAVERAVAALRHALGEL